MVKTPEGFHTCRIAGDVLRGEIRRLLRQAGDDIPENDILKGTEGENLGFWTAICSDEEPGRVAAAVRYDRTDWYSCTVKNLATDPEFRKRGLGEAVTRQAVDKAIDRDGCKVLLADITVGNEGSRRIFEDKLGFKVVDELCWASGEKPARIYHTVLKPPVDGRCQ